MNGDRCLGVQEICQLFKIFQVLGTPTEAEWPGVTQLPDFNLQFPHWEAQDLTQLLGAHLDPDGIDLVSRMLCYNPGDRISAAEALRHPFFKDLRSYQPGVVLPRSEFAADETPPPAAAARQ